MNASNTPTPIQRIKVQVKLGDAFEEMAFHDALMFTANLFSGWKQLNKAASGNVGEFGLGGKKVSLDSRQLGAFLMGLISALEVTCKEPSLDQLSVEDQNLLQALQQLVPLIRSCENL